MKRLPLLALAIAAASSAEAESRLLHCDLNEFRNGLVEKQSDFVLELDDARQSVLLGEGDRAVIIRYTDTYVTGWLPLPGMVFHLDRSNGMYSASTLENTGWSAIGSCDAG